MIKTIISLAFLLFSVSLFSQVGMNKDGSDPDASAMLDIESTEGGLLLPRLTTAEKDAISSPANGLLVFVTDATPPGFQFYDGSKWAVWKINDGGIYNGSGTVPASLEITLTDNINFDDGTLYIDGANDRVGINTTAPLTELHIDGNVRVTEGITTNSEIGEYVLNYISTTSSAKRFEIARSIIDNTANQVSGTIMVELFGRRWGSGSYKKYFIEHGAPSGDYRLSQVECIRNPSNTDEHRLVLGSPVTISGNYEYLPIYVDVEYYAHTVVRITTNRELATAAPHTVPDDTGKIWINMTPTSTSTSAFSADYTIRERTSLSMNGNLSPETNNTYDLGASSLRWNDVYATNGTIQTSDLRNKKKIKDLPYGISDLMKLNPISYNWKDSTDTRDKIGFLAQEVNEIVPEVVRIGDDDNELMGINYAELVSLLVKSLQDLKRDNSNLMIELMELEERLAAEKSETQ